MTRKATACVAPLSAAEFQPRFAYGHMAEAAVISGKPGDGTRLGTGFVRMKQAEIPWTIEYDEVILVLTGRLTVRVKGEDLIAGPMECIWLPNGTELTYIAEDALVFYAIEPANWAEDGP